MQPTETLTSKETVKLIRGTFSPEDAAEVLFSILSDKIRFHNIQVLSIKERFNGDTSYSEQRLVELKAAKEKVSQLILEAKNSNSEIEIQSDINIQLKLKSEA